MTDNNDFAVQDFSFWDVKPDDINPVRQTKVLEEVLCERVRQDQKWGGPDHDDEHTTEYFVEMIEDYAGWARVMSKMNSPEKARRRLIQVAAMAVAAVESLDRKTGNAVVLKKESNEFPHQKEFRFLSVEMNPPEDGQSVLSYRPTLEMCNGYEVIEWRSGDEDVYSSYLPLSHPDALPLFSVKNNPPPLGQVVLAYHPTHRNGNGFVAIKWEKGDDDVYLSWLPLARPAVPED